MRHHVSGKKLNRSSQHRQALFRNLVREVVRHGAIVTSPAKAAAVQGMLDTLIRKAQEDNVFNRRLLHRTLDRTDLVNRLVDTVAKDTLKRQSGFTRIVKLKARLGDNAPQVRLELVDYQPPAPVKPAKADKKGKPIEKKSKAKKADTKAKSPALPTPTPELKTQKPTGGAAIKPGMIRQKSGER